MPGWGSVVGAGGTNLLGSLGLGPGLLEQVLRGSLGSRPGKAQPVASASAMTVRARASAQGSAAAQGKSEEAGNQGALDRAALGKDDFLRLLLAELRMQDPINPVNDKEFLAQLAQFSALEQMTNLASIVQNAADAEETFRQQQQALALLGRQVEVVVASGVSETTEQTIRGRVEAIVWSAQGAPLLRIDGKEYPLDALRQVLSG